MQIIQFPPREQWTRLLQRPVLDNSDLESKVSDILKGVKQRGDQAVREFTERFDRFCPDTLEVSKAEIEEAINLVSPELQQAIQQAKENIEKFHRIQIRNEDVVETMPGVYCWRKSVAIEKVGLYIPGGSAPLFSTILMLAVPARLAGCREIILCTPAYYSDISSGANRGKVHPAVLYTAWLSGITRIFKIGGAQAIAAMAYGTASVPSVDKIFGPGNQYVTCAKMLIQKQGIAIDMPAGPSEVAVFADETANSAFVAADLLSQAEHGSDSQVVLTTTSPELIEDVKAELEKQLHLLSRRTLAGNSLKNSKMFLVKDRAEAMDLLNSYAPEHLILACKDAEELAEKVINAGSVFIGHLSPESAGDYASGTNHTLPTNGFARSYSGVSVDSFVKKITFQQLTQEGLQNISTTVERMAQAEGLDAHARAVKLRREAINKK
ncbi:MAG TPA: histidinol dehydrogenase [Parasegetibacter sp.]